MVHCLLPHIHGIDPASASKDLCEEGNAPQHSFFPFTNSPKAMTKQLLITGIIALSTITIGPMMAQENVGVGTIAPTSRLDVQGNASSTNTGVKSKINFIGNT